MNLREKVLKERFLAPGEYDEFDMFERVSQFIGSTTEEVEEFYRIMSELKFLPNTPTLVNAGREGSSGQLAACFVLPIEDSMEGIFTTLRDMALIQKTGGGVGYSFSRLRPKNAPVKSSLGSSSGPISFMKAYDAATDTVKQGGIRRGANMGVMRIDHPDIEEFIECKSDLTQLQNFNISVAITDRFMEAVEHGFDFPLEFNGILYKWINARDLFEKICLQAHTTGEPGIIFIDRVNDKHQLLDELIEATNPCGEQPLLPYETCNLGSINLSNHVVDGIIDYKELDKTVRLGVHFLDNVIDLNTYPLKAIEDRAKSNRKIGLGVMGYADMLIKLGLEYGSKAALDLTRQLNDRIHFVAEQTSGTLAIEKGIFPNIKNSKWNAPMRNASLTTIAPTGTISIIAECSSGIEPVFSPYYFTNRMDEQFLELHPLFEGMLKKKELLDVFKKEIVKYKDDLSKFDLKSFDSEIAALFKDVHQIGVEAHIDTQAVWQELIHSAISKTINLPNTSTVNSVRNAYIKAYKKGCKGVTIYRDGSRGFGVLSTKSSEETNNVIKEDREEWQAGMTTKVPTGCGNVWITINEDGRGNINEVFIRNGDDGGCPNIEGEARLISLALRRGITLDEVLDQLGSVKCSRSIASKRTKAKSCSDAIGRVIKEYVHLKDGTEPEKIIKPDANYCPACNEEMPAGAMTEGCITCRNCGWSQCS